MNSHGVTCGSSPSSPVAVHAPGNERPWAVVRTAVYRKPTASASTSGVLAMRSCENRKTAVMTSTTSSADWYTRTSPGNDGSRCAANGAQASSTETSRMPTVAAARRSAVRAGSEASVAGAVSTVMRAAPPPHRPTPT